MFKEKKYRFETCYNVKFTYVVYTEKPKGLKYEIKPSILHGIVYVYYYYEHFESLEYTRHYRHPKTNNERKQWNNYLDELKNNRLVLHKNRRSKLISSWDDYHCASNQNHKRSWKAHTKCKRQWMKNL